MYSPFIKELIDLPDVLIQKVRKEEERWTFELSLSEQCPLCPVCLKRTIKITGKKKQWMHGYAQRIGIFGSNFLSSADVVYVWHDIQHAVSRNFPSKCGNRCFSVMGGAILHRNIHSGGGAQASLHDR
ncbi:hypothetical protein LR69_04363 [Geobacillus sp. BCO2]|nr:hypothetical protein LR69_04363 [Geobacillus sp. BCO2]